MVAFLYIIIIFWEPTNQKDISLEKWGQTFKAIFWIELSILFLFLADAVMNIYIGYLEISFEERK